MSKLTREEVLRLAQLARLELSEAEIEEYRSELSDILQYVEHLQSVDIDGLEPTQQVTGLTNVTRDDTIVDYGYEPKDLQKNLPDSDNNEIKVKRMIG